MNVKPPQQVVQASHSKIAMLLLLIGGFVLLLVGSAIACIVALTYWATNL